MIDADEPWPHGPVDVERPEPWPPAELPPKWPAGADPEYVWLEATWGDEWCLDWVAALRRVNAGVAVDGQHRDLAAFAGGGD